MSNTVTIFGVRIDSLRRSELVETLSEYSEGKAPRSIATPNPEILLHAKKDPNFRKLLNEMDLNIADGFGLVLMNNCFLKTKLHRFTGVELVYELARLAAQQNKTLLLFGSFDGVAEKAAEKLNKKFNTDVIVGITPNSFEIVSGEVKLGHIDQQRIEELQPVMIAGAFGQYKQELFALWAKKHVQSVRISTGIGGALDMISGSVKRAPAFLRKVGLEWAWRLCIEPWRVKRVANAVIVFPFMYLLSKLKLV